MLAYTDWHALFTGIHPLRASRSLISLFALYQFTKIVAPFSFSAVKGILTNGKSIHMNVATRDSMFHLLNYLFKMLPPIQRPPALRKARQRAADPDNKGRVYDPSGYRLQLLPCSCGVPLCCLSLCPDRCFRFLAIIDIIEKSCIKPAAFRAVHPSCFSSYFVSLIFDHF